MRARIIVGAALVVAVLGVGTFTTRASEVGRSRQWTIVNFMDPVQVKGEFMMGPVLIEHDSEKMGRGEACTTFYRFDPAKGPQEKLVSFHCRPEAREVVAQTTFSFGPTQTVGCKRLLSYQIAGDAEAHGVPEK